MGAIAGSAILECSQTNTLDVVTITINNSCNLSCPHCYLQYNDATNGSFDRNILELIARSSFRHLAIVGKEPFLDTKSLMLCQKLADVCIDRGTSVSVVTNGLNGTLVPRSLLQQFAFVDVSLDSGRSSYGDYRQGSLSKLERSLSWIASAGTRINSLNVLNSTTINFLGEILRVRELAPFHRIVFSPYLRTSNQGINTVDAVSLATILGRIADSAFSETPNTTLLLHGEHLNQDRITKEAFWNLVDSYGLRSHVHLLEDYPLKYGVIRVTFDGFVMSPSQALHTRLYRLDTNVRVSDLSDTTLESAFNQIGKASLSVQ
jgi:sulfatase maturation enzyme AslB (radical SAM superfamily)